jgi:hypothetical protein
VDAVQVERERGEGRQGGGRRCCQVRAHAGGGEVVGQVWLSSPLVSAAMLCYLLHVLCLPSISIALQLADLFIVFATVVLFSLSLSFFFFFSQLVYAIDQVTKINKSQPGHLLPGCCSSSTSSRTREKENGAVDVGTNHSRCPLLRRYGSKYR